MGRFQGFIGFALVLITAFGLGVAGAAASPTTPTSIVVEVIGGGKVVTSGVGGINCGEGNLDCYATFSETSGTVMLKASPGNGWNAPVWTSCPSASGNLCTVPLDAGAHRVEVQLTNPNSTPLRTLSVSAPATGGDVTDADSPPGTNIDCGSGGGGGGGTTCTWQVIDQSTLTLIETPDSTYFFGGWAGNCASSGRACSVYMTSDAGVIASFGTSIATQTLTTHVVGNGTITGGGITCGSGATCDHTEAQNTSVTLTANASKGYLFTGWSGDCTGTQSTCTADMSAARDVTATFAQVFTLGVTVTGNGTVNGGTGFGVVNCGVSGTGTCSAPEPANGTVTLTEVPAAGATFSGWSGACSGLVTVCTVSMNTARTVTANFTGGTGGTTIPLTVSVTGSGTVSGPGISCAGFCTSNQNANASVTLSATPQSGGGFNGWGGACAGFGTITTCTITVSAAQTVSASFTTVTPSSFPLSVTVAGNGSVAGGGVSCGKIGTLCNVSLAPGTSVTLKATPTGGAKFVRWTGDCVGTTSTCVLVVGQARSVVATFSGGTPGGSTAVLKSLGAPTVVKSTQGYRVTLHFSTSSAGMITAQGLRAGRVTTSFKFESPAGSRTIGPFPVALPGYYTFKVSLLGTSHTLVWHACLGTCGVHAPASAGTFTVTRLTPLLRRAGAGWLVTLRFVESKPSGTEVRVLRSTGTLLGTYQFASGAGTISLRRLVLSPGSYRLRLTATDAYGRVRTLVYNVALHA